MAVGYLHILIITRGSILLVGCDIQLSATANRDILIIRRVTGTYFWAFLRADVYQSSRMINMAGEQRPKNAELSHIPYRVPQPEVCLVVPVLPPWHCRQQTDGTIDTRSNDQHCGSKFEGSS